MWWGGNVGRKFTSGQKGMVAKKGVDYVTPIVNNLKDLYSYVKFLNLSGGLEQLEVFNSQLIRPLNAGDGTANLLLQAIMSCLCLRRKKDMQFVNLRLPELTEYVHRVTFLDHEREKYEAFQYADLSFPV